MSIEPVTPSNHLILCRPLHLPPSIFPSIRVFSNESALHIRWPKYWSFSFNISPSNEHSGLISFRRDWLDLLAVQGALKSLLQHHRRLSIQALAEEREAAGPTPGLRAGFPSQQASSQPQADEYLSIRALRGNGRLGGFLCVSVTESRPILCDPMGCIPPGSPVHGILQARILEWVAISFSRRVP